MSCQERTYEEILSALERWVQRHPHPDEIVFALGERNFTLREYVEAFRNKDELVMEVYTWMMELFKLQGIDPVEKIDRSGKGEGGTE